jgi:septal ring factor EnvC (AmiA/AmiB activator)
MSVEVTPREFINTKYKVKALEKSLRDVTKENARLNKIIIELQSRLRILEERIKDDWF